MGKESLEKISRLQSLEAENTHLKNLLSRYAGKNDEVFSYNESLEKKIELLSHKNIQFNNSIVELLGYLGKETGVDRVSVFLKNDKDNCYYAKYQWTLSGVQQYYFSDLVIEEKENPCINDREVFGKIEDELFTKSLVQKFEIFDVKSLLFVPFSFSEHDSALIVLESCHFSRGWYSFEIDQLKKKLKVISSFFKYKREQEDAKEECVVKSLHSELSQIIISETKETVFYELLNKVGIRLGLKKIGLVGRRDDSLLSDLSVSYEENDSGFSLTFDQIEKFVGDSTEGDIIHFQIFDLISKGIQTNMEGEGLLLRIPIESKDIWLLVNILDVIRLSNQKMDQFLTSLAQLLAMLLIKFETDNENKEKLEQSEVYKNSFLTNLSHELRTPLNAIVGFSALLKGNSIGPQERDEYIDVILKNSDSLMTLINNIVDVTKMDYENILIEKESLDPDQLMDVLYREFVVVVEKKHQGRVKLYLSKDTNFVSAFISDPIRLKQVLVNLIANAIKFTLKGFVEFGYEVKEDYIRFFVRDTGIGISKEKQKRIFEPFQVEEKSQNQVYGGTGIGLAVCKQIVDALGGQIGVMSQKGEGAEFFFIHPFEKSMSGEVTKKVFVYNDTIMPNEYHWSNKLILLVDENSSDHLKMRKYFDKTGLTLVSARTAVGASKLMLNRSDVDLVLMDLNFPDSNGYDLLSVLKSQNNAVPVVVYSLKVNEEKGEFFKDKGFDASIAKPAEKDDILVVLDKFL